MVCSQLNHLENYVVYDSLIIGMGDTCCNPASMGSIKNIIEQTVPGIYVHSLKIGSSFIDEVVSSYFVNINDQVIF
jgi:palmitoyl-protein thioesterase